MKHVCMYIPFAYSVIDLFSLFRSLVCVNLEHNGKHRFAQAGKQLVAMHAILHI